MDGFHNIRCGIWVCLAGSLLAGTGCTTLTPLGSNPFSMHSTAVEPEAATAAGNKDSYQLVVQPSNGKPRMIEKPLNGSKHLQDALTENKAFRQFNRCEFELQRKLPNGGYHRMQIEHSVATSRVDPEFDYVLHPGDRVVVKEDPRTVVDDFMDTALKPLGLDRPKKEHLRDEVSSKYRFVN